MPDPVTTGLITGGIVGGLTKFWERARDKADSPQSYEHLTGSELFKEVLADLQDINTPASAAIRRYNYFRELEFQALLQQITLLELAGIAEAHLPALIAQVESGLARFDSPPTIEAARTAQDIVEAVTSALRTLLQDETMKPLLPNSEDVATMSSAITVAQLNAIQRQISKLTSPSVDHESLATFAGNYRGSFSAAHSFIRPPNIDQADPVDIDRIFVPARVSLEQQTTEIVAVDDLPAGAWRYVILGNPGGGKTTLSTKLALDCNARERSVPFLVTLREFAAAHRRSALSVAEYISQDLRTTYQCTLSVPEVEYLLDSGQATVFFDGLDELLEPDYRTKVVGIIEAFSAVFISCPILCTSRAVGYGHAPLSKRAFHVARLLDLTDDAARQYVSNWFGLQANLTSAQQTEMAERFFNESSVAPDLRRNPLMLSLLCSIYRTEAYIPRNRPDVYARCSQMLFLTWDRHRGLLQPLEYEAHLEGVLQFLASWIYNDQELQAGVTEYQLIAKAAEYLHAEQFHLLAEARLAASDMITFFRGRAWVLTDTGLSADGESLYQFTHRTFLEYFAAGYLSQTLGQDELVQVVADSLARYDFDVVGHLALQMKSRDHRGAADEIVRALLVRLDTSDDRPYRTHLLEFICSALSFFVLRPPTLELLASVVLDCISRLYGSATALESPASPSLESIVESLAGSARENRRSLAAAICNAYPIALQSAREHGLNEEMLLHLPERLDDPELGPELQGCAVQMQLTSHSALRLRWREFSWAPSVLLFADFDMSADTVREIIMNLDGSQLLQGPDLPGFPTRSYYSVILLACRTFIRPALRPMTFDQDRFEARMLLIASIIRERLLDRAISLESANDRHRTGSLFSNFSDYIFVKTVFETSQLLDGAACLGLWIEYLVRTEANILSSALENFGTLEFFRAHVVRRFGFDLSVHTPDATQVESGDSGALEPLPQWLNEWDDQQRSFLQ